MANFSKAEGRRLTLVLKRWQSVQAFIPRWRRELGRHTPAGVAWLCDPSVSGKFLPARQTSSRAFVKCGGGVEAIGVWKSDSIWFD